MIVICQSCGRKYKIDPDKIKGERARFTCKGCSAMVTVDKAALEEEALDEDLLMSSPAVRQTTTAEKKETAVVAPPASSEAGSDPTTSKAKSRSGLTAKVILLMLLVGIVPGSIYFALSFRQTNRRILTETQNHGMQISSILASEVDEWIDKNVRVLSAAAELPAMQSMDPDQQEAVLKAVQTAYPWMYLVFSTDVRGINLARSDSKPLKDYSSRQYVKDVVEGKELAWQNLIGKTSKKPSLVLAVPIRNDGQTVGVLASAMTREAISSLVTDWEHGQTGSVFLLDEQGKVVAHQHDTLVTEERDLSDHPLIQATRSSGRSQAEFTGEDGEAMIGFAQPTRLGWILALQQEKREAFRELAEAQQSAYILLAGTVLIILLVATLCSRAIVTPIRKLTEAANRISVGELDVEIAAQSRDEIGELADAITRMQDSIRLSIARLQRQRA
jgi:methyl-accepting chemotaxis protein